MNNQRNIFVGFLKLIKKILAGNTVHAAKSETALCRQRLKKYCAGNGIDLGYGGDPIVPTAITMDLPQPYRQGNAPLNLMGNAADLYWFRDETLDYVYSSHLLEDFEDTEAVLKEWLRVIKPGGHLVLYCPDENLYRRHCQKTGQPYNQHHKIAEFSLNCVLKILQRISRTKIIHANPRCEQYSFELVAIKQ